MPKKQGAGGEPQEYNSDTGKYTKQEELERKWTGDRSVPLTTARSRLISTIRKIDVSKILGEEFKGYKGQKAINKLIKERRGHVKNAFYNEDIGYIDLLWGNSTLGLKHIIERRGEQSLDIDAFLSDLSEVVEHCDSISINSRGSFELKKGRKVAIIRKTYHGNTLIYLITAYPQHGKQKAGR